MADKTNIGEFLGIDLAGMATGDIAQFWNQSRQILAPILALQAQGAASQGRRLQQTMEQRLGSGGLGVTGLGAGLKSLGGTYAAQQIASQRLGALLSALQFSQTAGVQTATSKLQGFVSLRSAEVGANAQSGEWWERALGALSSGAGAYAGAKGIPGVG